MRLNEYLTTAKISLSDAAKSIGCTPEAVSYWARGLKLPSEAFMVKIFNWSNGQVTPNDFYELPDLDLQGGALVRAGSGAGCCQPNFSCSDPEADKQIDMFHRAVAVPEGAVA